MTSGNNGNPRYRWFILLLLPFIGVLWVPAYNRIAPDLWGIPFFFWYQFAWVFLSAAITAIVYVKSEPHHIRPRSTQPIDSRRPRG